MNGWCQYTFPRLLFLLYAEKAHACGISREKSILILLAGSRSTHWDMRHPVLREALNEQATAGTGNGYTNEPALLLAKTGSTRPSPNAFLCNSGAEANEAALNWRANMPTIAGNHKSGIVAFKNAFHGRTLYRQRWRSTQSIHRTSRRCRRIFVMQPITISLELRQRAN